jgi:2-(1,2-epoxy-1,2-dihydrophenyl)acetyl-CoA isomerase
MSENLAILAWDGPVATITLNATERLNAFTARLHAELRTLLDQIESAPSCRCLIITGAGRAFCAGQDLNERVVPDGAPAINIGEKLDADLNPLVRRLRAAPFPVIAAVNGTAAGAGVGLALAADIILAARSAMFALSFTRIGLGPDGGLSWMLPRMVGHARAAGLALLGSPIDASIVEQWGLIWRMVEDLDLLSEAQAMALELSQRPRKALTSAKRLLYAGWLKDFDDQLTSESLTQSYLGFTGDYREGVRAFVEKRKPRFED